MRAYNEALSEYNAAFKAYEEKCKQNRKTEHETYELAVTAAQNAHKEEVLEVEKALEECKHQINALISQAMGKRESILSAEIEEAEKMLRQLIVCRKQYYAQDVIYPKYRNIVAIASFNDYIMSGRCDSLFGANGAYDKYEMDCRADLIISKLSEVVSSLDAIKEGQYMLYSQITEVNKGLSRLNSAMDKALAEVAVIGSSLDKKLTSIDENTKSISEHTANVAQNTEIVAYNTAVTAYYSKRNVELTDALGFMVALK